MSITQDEYGQKLGFPYVEDGGVTSARGFKAAGIHAGFRANPNRLDFALVVSDEPASTAAVFTQNVFCAAPVLFSKRQLSEGGPDASYGTARAIAINSGNANAATGVPGLETAEAESHIIADALGCSVSEVLIASTGVIGVPLPLEPFETGVPQAVSILSPEGGGFAASAIHTTDTCEKECAVKFAGDDIGFPGETFTVGGMAKGSGMIMPNMATMIAVLTTDAPLYPEHLHSALKTAVDQSFNKITVDSDTSTNDSCFLMSSGCLQNASAQADSGSDPADAFMPSGKAYKRFVSALTQVCVTLARAMARDGEGASRLITVNVKGAKTPFDADLAARTVANSPLVKTAVAGRDANWGRIAAAIGRSGAQFAQEDVDIDIMGIPVCRKGLALSFDEDEALRRFENPEITIDIDLGAGSDEATIWTCDFTHDYISINADYRS